MTYALPLDHHIQDSLLKLLLGAEAIGLRELASCWMAFGGTFFDLSNLPGPTFRLSQCVVSKKASISITS